MYKVYGKRKHTIVIVISIINNYGISNLDKNKETICKTLLLICKINILIKSFYKQLVGHTSKKKLQLSNLHKLSNSNITLLY